jgi:hypothetical protein
MELNDYLHSWQFYFMLLLDDWLEITRSGGEEKNS